MSTPTKAKFNHDRIRVLPLAAIRPSPENATLYRPVTPDDSEVKKLAESIREDGWLPGEEIVVSADGYIISGHRRHVAGKLAGKTEAPCRVSRVRRLRRDGTVDPRFVRLLALYNRQRVKSRDELLREAAIDIDPDDAYRALTQYRDAESKKKLAAPTIRIEGKKRRAQISKAKAPMLAAVKKIIYGMEKFWPLSVRQVHYNLLNDPPLIHASKPNSTYANDKDSYQAAVDLLSRARLEEIIPWDAIADETRPVTTWRVWRNVQPYLANELDKFLLDYWRDLMQSQHHHIEIIGEKNTLAGTIRPVAAKFCIPFCLGRGYSSLAPRHEMAERYRDSGKDKLILLFLGDHDPEGEDIPHSFARSMRDDFDIERVEAVKVALTAAQVKKYRLPPVMEAKKTSARYEGYVKKYGTTVHEIEALPPARLQSLLTEAVDAVIARRLYNAEVADERADAESLATRRKVVLDALRG